jgi:hypothetical protein
MTWFTLLRRKGQTWLNLSAQERSLLGQALWLLPLVSVMLRLGGLAWTQRWLMVGLRPNPAVATGAGLTLDQAWQMARLVRVATRYSGPWVKCLQRSLVLWGLLRQQGCVSDLRIGVQRQDGKFTAHAWVEYDGVVLLDAADVAEQFPRFEHSF